MKFKRTKVKGDGNCLFRAVSSFLYGHERFFFRLRERAVTEIYNKWNSYCNYLDVDHPENVRKTPYCRDMAKNGTYATTVEIMALSEVLKVTFHVFHIDEAVNPPIIEINERPQIISKEPHERVCHLLHVGSRVSGHFELISPHRENSPSPDGGQNSSEVKKQKVQ